MSHNSDMIKMLRLVEGQQFAGEPGQQAGDQVRGIEKAAKNGQQHPFHSRLVGEEISLEDKLSKKYQDMKDLHGKEVAEVSDNALKSYQQKVSSDSMKHKADPTKRSPEKANRSVAGFAKAQNRLEQGVAEGSNGRGPLWMHDKHGNEIRKGTVLKNTRTGKTGPATGMSSQAGKTHLTIQAHDDSYWDNHDNYEVVKKEQGVAEGLNEFAAGGGGDSGNYFQALASAWYNGAFDTGSLQKGIKSKEDVERLLQRGIVCPDGVTRKFGIDYNSDFDGVVISSDDYYEHADHDETDSRTGKPFGPYDYMEFGDEELDESAKYRDPKYKGQLYTQEPPDYNDSREFDNAMWNPKPDDYPGRKELPGGGEYDRTDPLVRGVGIGRSGIKNNILDRGKRKGLPSRDQITSLKQSIKDIRGRHTRANLPEQGVAEGLNEFAPPERGDGQENRFNFIEEFESDDGKYVIELYRNVESRSFAVSFHRDNMQYVMYPIDGIDAGDLADGADRYVKEIKKNAAHGSQEDFVALGSTDLEVFIPPEQGVAEGWFNNNNSPSTSSHSSPYQVLGFDITKRPFRNPSSDVIKQAYRVLASKHHPDKGGDPALFQKITAAYKTLISLGAVIRETTDMAEGEMRDEPAKKAEKDKQLDEFVWADSTGQGMLFVAKFLMAHPTATSLAAGAVGLVAITKIVKAIWKNHKALVQLRNDVTSWSRQKLTAHNRATPGIMGSKVAKIVQAEIDKRKNTDTNDNKKDVAEGEMSDQGHDAPAGPGNEHYAKLQARLKELEARFDPNFEYSDDHSVWSRHNKIYQEIQHIKRQLSQGNLDESQQESPMEGPMLNRIMMRHMDLIEKYGIDLVLDSVRDVADSMNIGPDDEIGTSDVSAAMVNVMNQLKSLDQQIDEYGSLPGTSAEPVAGTTAPASGSSTPSSSAGSDEPTSGSSNNTTLSSPAAAGVSAGGSSPTTPAAAGGSAVKPGVPAAPQPNVPDVPITPDEKSALDRIRANAGLKTQFDNLLKQVQPKVQ